VTGRRRDKGKCRKLETTVQDADRRQDQVQTGEPHCRLQIGETRLVIDRKGRTQSETGQPERLYSTSGDKPGVSKGAIRRYSTTSTYRAVNGVPKL